MPIKPWGGVSDWACLKEVAAQGYNDAIVCLGSIETVVRSNRPSVIEPLQRCEGGRSARLLIDAALFRVHIYVVRAFAPVRYADDLHLRAAIEFLKVPGRLSEIQDVEDRGNLEQAILLFDKASADARLVKLTHLRHKMLVHWAAPDPSIPIPTYNDLFEFTRLTAKIWECLAFGTRTMTVDLSAPVEAYQESADSFWSVWER